MGIPSNGASAKMVDKPIAGATQRPGCLAKNCRSHESSWQADHLAQSVWQASAPSYENSVTLEVALSLSIVE